MTTFGFNLEDAKRIGRAVRLVERDEPRQELVGDQAGVVSRGVRLLLAKHSGAAWPKETTAVVTIHNGDTIAAAGTVVALNQFLTFSTNNDCTQNWVALGHNGWNWIAVSREQACTESTATCSMVVGGVDFSVVQGYAATATQVLGHESGCIKWLNVATCSTSTTA